MEAKKRFWVGNVLVTLAIVAGSIAAVIYRQDIIDWWRLQSYKPSPAIVQLADNATMQGRGRELFYISEPVIEDRQAFNQNCTNQDEESIVLGCYKAQKIYLFNVTDQRLAGVKEVTAAHEMLHAAYERLSADERKHINTLLEPQMQQIADPRLTTLIKLYNKQEPGELYNEMHSILATEYPNLSPELETYYKRYFSNRQKIVQYSQNYEGMFLASKERIAQYDERLNTLKQQIDANNAQLETQQALLEAESQRLNRLQAQSPETYNREVPPYNDKVRSFNVLVNTTKALVDEYNALVETRNQEAAAQNDLFQGLDSRYQAVPQTP